MLTFILLLFVPIALVIIDRKLRRIIDLLEDIKLELMSNKDSEMIDVFKKDK
jgi:hypothetical protein